MNLLSAITGWKRGAIIVFVCLVILGGLTVAILAQWANLKSWAVRKLAIEKPAKIETVVKIEYRDRWHDRIIIERPDGTKITKESTHESGTTTSTAHVVSTPMIPEAKPQKINTHSYYISGGVGAPLSNTQMEYLLGGGIYVFDWLTVGVQIQTNGEEVRGYGLITVLF